MGLSRASKNFLLKHTSMKGVAMSVAKPVKKGAYGPTISPPPGVSSLHPLTKKLKPFVNPDGSSYAK